MTTFTLQDLTPEQQVALNNHEEMHKMFQDIGSVFVGEGKTAVFNAPEPQPTTPTPTGTNVPDLASVLQTISEQFALLSTVISSSATKTQAEDQSLQDCVALTLQQADWFKEMVADEVDRMDFGDLVTESVKVCVESEVDHYFRHQFDPTDHFDFSDAVEDAVSDNLEDAVRNQIDDKLEEVVAEKLSEASVSISF